MYNSLYKAQKLFHTKLIVFKIGTKTRVIVLNVKIRASKLNISNIKHREQN